MSQVNLWRVYCETESDWSYRYLAEGTIPSKCFNDTAHTININSLQKIETVSNSNVLIIEESIPTNGNHKSVGYKCECTVGVSTHDFSFDIPISALSISFNTHADNQNDTLEVIIGPETPSGVITSDVSIGDTIINVSPTVIENVQLGYYVNLSDSTNNDNLGIVKTATSNAFLASSPTYVKLSVKAIDNFTFGYPGRYVIGESKIGGSYVPKNTIVRVVYTNNGNATRYFYPNIDYLY
jgi:hypothetical protein